ncbi:MAG: hypothetical protein EG822_06120 [Deltaproteobacteria bacterium]|nr:hypothetical protein [Deltaproteobacteria bacterium]TLN04947.1 MAG: hypothetical protein FDZ73_01425 [bacterium]
MDNETNKYETPTLQTAADSGSVTAAAQNILDKSTEAYGKAEQAVGEAYEKTTQKVKETYEKAKSYTDENPGKTILIALGIGVGIGLLLGAGSSHHRSRAGRIAQPVVNALSEIAHEFFR